MEARRIGQPIARRLWEDLEGPFRVVHEGSALLTAIHTEQRPGRGRERPTTRYHGMRQVT